MCHRPEIVQPWRATAAAEKATFERRSARLAGIFASPSLGKFATSPGNDEPGHFPALRRGGERVPASHLVVARGASPSGDREARLLAMPQAATSAYRSGPRPLSEPQQEISLSTRAVGLRDFRWRRERAINLHGMTGWLFGSGVACLVAGLALGVPTKCMNQHRSIAVVDSRATRSRPKLRADSVTRVAIAGYCE